MMELRFGRLPSSSGNRSPSCFSHRSTSCAPESSLSSRLSPRGKSLPRRSPSFTSISPSDNFVMGCGRGGDASCLSLCWGRAFLASLCSFQPNDPTPARSWMLLTPEPRVPCCSKRIPDLFYVPASAACSARVSALDCRLLCGCCCSWSERVLCLSSASPRWLPPISLLLQPSAVWNLLPKCTERFFFFFF